MHKYLCHSFPALIREDQRLFLVASVVFLICTVSSFTIVQFEPELVYLLYGEYQLAELIRAYHPDYRSLMRFQPLNPWQDSLFYFFNNSLVGLQLCAAGLLPGVGTLILLAYGGVSLGALMGYIYARGYAGALWPAIVGHSSLEVLATVLSATAGFCLGRWLLGCVKAKRLVEWRTGLGRVGAFMGPAIVLYALAAVIEANWSHHPVVPAVTRYVFGAGLWLSCLAYFAWILLKRVRD